MTSKIKVDNISKVSDDTNIINRCGTTVTVGSAPGNFRSGTNNLQAADGGNLISQSGTTITLGASGDTVELASGASQSGFGRTGTVDWQTGSIKTGDFTAVDGQGFFVNTTSGAVEVTLPTGSAGSIVSLQDYNNTFDTNNCTVTAAGSQKINGGTAGGNVSLSTEGEGITLVYIDSTVGWRSIQDNTFADSSGIKLIATGGNTVATCGNFKIHTFTSPGTFTVTQVSDTAAENTVGYLVIGGGGAGGTNHGGGGGAGGFREGRNAPIDNFTASPLVACAPTNAVTVTAQAYPITVGGGGSAPGGNGNASTFDSITSAAGGGGGSASGAGSPGGSGGGAGGQGGPGGGNGNTPSVTPAQGKDGGCAANPDAGAGGGGGATVAGGTGQARPGPGGPGGAGASSSITGASVARGGGGGGGNGGAPGPLVGGTGGTGGGGNGGGSPFDSSVGTDNTGGGGGGGANPAISAGTTARNGGSGIVIIRYKYQ